jgi:glutamate 5-kinase
MAKLKRVVIKIGTSILVDENKKISIKRVADLARQVKQVRDKGIKPIIVSSGAIACGMEMLGLKKKPKEIEKKQALAAIGQSQLMKMYMEAFAKKKIKVGQVLLTHEDIKSKTRCLNLMNTLNTLLDMDIIPVINENDTLSFKEIRFGDNDNLSALIAQITDADLLLLLSDVEGLFDKDPHKNPDARIIRLVEKIDEKIGKMAGGTRSEQSTGGMQSKLEAVKKAGAYGIPTMIVRGGTKEIILKAIRGEKVGTLFQPARKLARNKWWTAFAFKVKGKIQIDKGAEQAVLVNKKSLLPAGIKGVKGDFSRGDCVEVINMEGRAIAKGVANYSAADIQKIKGMKSMEIEKKLGYAYAEEVVHRDNMVVLC